MKITQTLLDELTAEAKENPRLRCNLDMRNSADDQSQRMLTLSTSVTTRHSSSMLGSALAAPSVECPGARLTFTNSSTHEIIRDGCLFEGILRSISMMTKATSLTPLIWYREEWC